MNWASEQLGDQLRQGGTAYSAMDGPRGGPTILPRTVRGGGGGGGGTYMTGIFDL